MIKRLRLRFILVALLSVLVVLSGTIALINAYNYSKIDKEAKHSLTLVVEQESRYADPEPYDPNQPGGGWNWSGMMDDSLMREHYFVVSFDENGEINYSDFMHVFSINEEDGKALATTIYNGQTNNGSVDNYWYKKEKRRNNTYVAFLDVKEKMNNFNNFLQSSLGVSAISYAVLAGLIVVASFFVFKTSEESYRKQKAFITNASHELKTPLTIINTDLEIVEMDSGKSEWTESIRDQVKRLTTMTTQLVTLSKLDENNYKNYPFETFSLSKLANECAEAFLPTYEKNNLKFISKIKDNIDITANKYLINELFYIFLDNALKYAKKNGEVGLTVSKNNKKVTISFYNDVEESNQIDVKLLFERFYRSPDAKKEGSGIGLSIAKEIVDLHKGKISASIKDQQILFNISL